MPPLGNENRGLLRNRLLFNSREQKPSESLEDFVKSLKELSHRCKYDAPHNLVQELIRDRLIVGLKSKEIQTKLLNCSDNLTLDNCIEVANSTEVAKSIKQELDRDPEDDFEDLPSIHDKLQVQVSVDSFQNPDIKVSEEAKIAILIELLNHKAVVMAPSGHEWAKADLWEKVFEFAKSAGAPFRTALHLREVFGTWKDAAIQARQSSSQEDVKMSNADKLMCDLLNGDDNLEDYPTLGSGANGIIDDSAELFAEEDDEVAHDVNFTFDENDLGSSTSTEEDNDHDSDEDYAKPQTKRRRGRPARESIDSTPKNSTSINNELKNLILKRLVSTKHIIAGQGNEKEKKDVWRSIYKSLEKKLTNSSPSALRSAFRIWKNKAMKKRENSDETVTESDRLIYNIFDLQEPELRSGHDDPIEALIDEVKEEAIDSSEYIIEEEDPGRGYIDHSSRISILHEVAKHREVIGMNMGSVYEKESAWREIHEKISVNPRLKYLSVRKMKELMKMWQAKAFHAALKQGGPMTTLQKLMYHIYAIGMFGFHIHI